MTFRQRILPVCFIPIYSKDLGLQIVSDLGALRQGIEAKKGVVINDKKHKISKSLFFCYVY